MTTKTLNVTLQFHFDRFGELQETFVSSPPSTIEVQGSWTSPSSQWSPFDRVRVEVSTVRPPNDITYTLLVNNTPTEIGGGYFHCVLGLLAEGTSFAVKARYGGHEHQVRMIFAPKQGLAASVSTVDRRKSKIAIYVPPTTDPPPSTPIGSEIDDLVALLPDLINDLRDRMKMIAGGSDTGPLPNVLRSAEALVQRFNFLGRPSLDNPGIKAPHPTQE